MPDFKRPGRWYQGGLYPHQAGTFIEQLRRFIGNDRLLRQVAAYRATGLTADGIKMARLREKQPLIEAFETYEKATFHRLRPLRFIDDQLAELANVAAHYSVVSPTLAGTLEEHQRQKLIDLNGQLKPLLLEWKTASHFARTHQCELAWLDVDQTGPELVARARGVEWEVECKFQSQMITELLGQSEADHIAGLIVRRLRDLVLQGFLVLNVPAEFDARDLSNSSNWPSALDALNGPGTIQMQLPDGIYLEGDVRPVDGTFVTASEWQDAMSRRKPAGARLYAYARAVGSTAVNPIELQMIGPRRTGVELVEYLWDRKFQKAAKQCSGTRGAVLAFEWEGLDDPKIFEESPGIQSLLARTFDEYRHVAAIALRCDAAPTRSEGLINYSVGAYLSRSNVTTFPQVAGLVRLDPGS